MRRIAGPLLATALLAGCGGGGAPPVAGVSADEAAQLNRAAAMLDDGAANADNAAE